MKGDTGDPEAEPDVRGAQDARQRRRRTPAEPPAPLPSRDPDSLSVSRHHVLVVDDHHDSAECLGMLLEALGAVVRVAHDGSEALAAFDECRPAAVLLDIGMPGMDGYEVARQIRGRAVGKRVSLIALTGWSQEKHRRRARKAGFDHYLLKPPDLEMLRDLLASALAPDGKGSS